MATTPLPEQAPPADLVPIRSVDGERAWGARLSGSSMRLPLRVKIILPFLLLTLLLALAGAFIATRLVSGSLEERTASHLGEATAAIRASLQRIEQEQLVTLRTVIHTQGVAQAMATRDLARLGELIVPINISDALDSVEIIASDGQELTGIQREAGSSTGTGYGFTVGRDLSRWPLVQRILADASPTESERPAQLVQTDVGYMLYTGSSVWHGEKLIGGVLVGRSWEDILRELSLETLAQLVVVDVEGNVVGSTVSEAVSSTQLPPLADSAPSPAAFAAPQPWEWQGQAYHLQYAPLEIRGNPLGTVAVILPGTDISSTTQLGRDALLALFALASVLVMGTGYLLANRITGPVKSMVQAFQRLAVGDFSPRLETERRDEFGVLAEAFNTMTRDLEVRTDRLRSKVLQLRLMYDTSEQLSRSLELDRVLEVTADTFHASADWSFTALLLLEPGTSLFALRCLRPRSLDHQGDVTPPVSLPMDASLVEALRNTKPTIMADQAIQPFLSKIGVGTHIGPVMVIPLRSGDPLGVVLAGAEGRERLPSRDRSRLIATLAGEAARAIQSAQLYRQVSRQVAQLVALQEASRGLASKLTPDEVLRQTADELASVVPDGDAVIALLDPSTGQLEPRVRRGTLDTDWAGRRVAEAVLRDGRPRWFDPEDSSLNPDDPGSAPVHLRPGLCVPLQVEGEAIGAIHVTLPAEMRSSKEGDQLLLLTTIANQAAVALKNARLYQEIQRLYLSIVQSLAAAIDARDPHTHGHAQRVVSTALKVARKIGLPDEDLPVLEVAAYLHDIGKLGVPDEILLKPGSLNARERRIIDGHPDLGARILDPVGFDPRVLSCIVQHRERYDGTGYPQGRKGNDIAAGARILGAVDAFDAMLSERPYRAPLTLEETLDELRSGAGTQFDPVVVAAIVSLVESEELPVREAPDVGTD